MDEEQLTLAQTYRPLRRSPANRYQDMDLAARVEGASPHALVAILYAELSGTLAVLARAIEVNDDIRKAAHYMRAASILRALDAGLDRDNGGTLSASLTVIYRQLQNRLAVARDGNAQALIDVREGIARLAGAWSRIA